MVIAGTHLRFSPTLPQHEEKKWRWNTVAVHQRFMKDSFRFRPVGCPREYSSVSAYVWEKVCVLSLEYKHRCTQAYLPHGLSRQLNKLGHLGTCNSCVCDFTVIHRSMSTSTRWQHTEHSCSFLQWWQQASPPPPLPLHPWQFMVSGLFCPVILKCSNISHAIVIDGPWKVNLARSRQGLFDRFKIAYSHLRSSRNQLCEGLLYCRLSCGAVSKGQRRNGIVPSFLPSVSTCQCLSGARHDPKKSWQKK